jgi:hypothetical protein
MPTISGTVYDYLGSPTGGRIVRAYRRDTGAFLAETQTDTGADPHFSNVALLLPFTEPEGSTTFADISANGLTGSPSGGSPAVTQLDGPFPGAGCFNTNGGMAAVNSTTLFDVAADQAYTLEFFLKVNALPGSFGQFFMMGPLYGSINSSGIASIVHYNSQDFSGTLTTGQWYHMAICKEANGTRRTFLNGVASSPQSNPVAIDTNSFGMGNHGGSFEYSVNVRFAQLRLTIGVARYTANFAPLMRQLPTNVPDPEYAGKYSLTTAHTGECNVFFLDDVAGPSLPDLVARTVPV